MDAHPVVLIFMIRSCDGASVPSRRVVLLVDEGRHAVVANLPSVALVTAHKLAAKVEHHH